MIIRLKFVLNAVKTCRMFSSDIISAKQLFAELQKPSKPKLIDTRPPQDFEQSHISGARNVHEFFTYLVTDSGAERNAKLRNDFAKTLGSQGISNEDRIVVYEESMNSMKGSSCRAHFLLKYLGVRDVAVLHGGINAWLHNKYPVTNEIPSVDHTDFKPNPDDSLMANKDDVLKAISDAKTTIVDCRDADEWIGESSSPYGAEYCPRKGRIPNAKWLDWNLLMTEDANGISVFHSPQEVHKICQKAGIPNKDDPVIIYCFKGARASNTMLAMKLAGYTNVKNYFASWNEWSRDHNLPVDSKLLRILSFLIQDTNE